MNEEEVQEIKATLEILQTLVICMAQEIDNLTRLLEVESEKLTKEQPKRKKRGNNNPKLIH